MEKYNLKTATLIANTYDEYYIYKSEEGNYFIKYTRDFYMKHAKCLPEFSEIKEYEDITYEELKEHLKDIKDYYGSMCILLDEYKNL